MSWFFVLRRLLWRVFLGITTVFMLVVIFGVAYWAWTSIADGRLERKVSGTRAWPSTEVGVPIGKDRKERALALKATVKTRCSESILYYILTVEKNGAVTVSEDFDELVNRLSQFDVQLLDSDDFQVSSITVPLAETRRLLGKSGRAESREANASTTCEKRAYARVARVVVGWTER